MTRREALMIASLSLIWGSSFMFIKVADRQFDPGALVFFRLLLASAVVVPVAFAVVGRDLLSLARPVWGRLVVLGLVNTTIPFLLISWAETRLDSGLAAILQAAAPIFSAVIATRFGNDRVTGYRLAGVLIGLAGVALLVGSPGGGGLLAALAVVLAALAYASAASFGSHMLVGTPPLVVAAGSTTAAMIAVAPYGLARLPGTLPGWKENGSVAMLGIVGTGIAYIILFALLRTAGPSRTILITYLIPGVAVLYGVLLLGEPVRAISLAGLALVLAGVALASRVKRSPRRPSPAVATAATAD
ncbi:MAG TPA: DMT family transporter [Gaiellaceae bacterium]|nr:DMT family transporter [Gaiellaceae bacterium]